MIKPLLFNIIIGFALSYALPWWIICCVCILSSIIFKTRALPSFFIGFISIFILWTFYASYLGQSNDFIMTSKMGQLFGDLNAMTLIIIAGIIGGLYGGLSQLCGSYFSDYMFNKSNSIEQKTN